MSTHVFNWQGCDGSCACDGVCTKCVCVCVCLYVCLYLCVVCVCLWLRARVCVCVCPYVRAYVCACMRSWIFLGWWSESITVAGPSQSNLLFVSSHSISLPPPRTLPARHLPPHTFMKTGRCPHGTHPLSHYTAEGTHWVGFLSLLVKRDL